MSDVSTALVTELTSMVTTLSSSLASIAPLAVSLIGIGLVVTLGIKMFKRVTNKA